MARRWVRLALEIEGFQELDEDERLQAANNAVFAVRTGNGPNGSRNALELLRRHGSGEGLVRARSVRRIRKLLRRTGYVIGVDASPPFTTNTGCRPSYGQSWRRT
jgi:hypothetical protein